ncbi:beta-galactosidase [Lactobacillus paragasseri]|uniref:beta-galactosidase n=1 Tax=Lactobacillus paragasseri TaxID=2107999 RepID=UPI000F6EB9E7|nr:beta-galactosidase [Lactobacillus paragasseri]VEF34995.1 beta-galactosidase [Lactobacillus paragasseri]
MKRILNTNEFLHGGDYNPEQWWDEPDVINQDFALFKQAKINTVTVGIFSWAKLEPEEGNYDFSWLDSIFDRVEEMNGHVVLATPSGARPAWLAQKYPEVLRTDNLGNKRGFGGRHNHCLTSPIYREKVREINTKLAEHFGQRKSLVLWHISNEYSGECYCELCKNAFREWLKNKYGNLDNLNHAWWNTFWSHTYNDWSQVNPPSPLSEMGNKGMNLDWKRFITDQTISFIDNETAPLKKITPNIPVTTNMMAGNPLMDPFAGFDYQKVAKHLDFISWDSYPAWGNDNQTTAELGRNVGLIHDFFRSLKHQNFLVMENTPSRVNWHSVDRAKRPGMHELASLQDVARGSQGVLYFQLRASQGSSEMFHGAVIEHRHPEQTRAFKDVTKVGKDLEKIRPIVDTNYLKAKVAIVFSYDSYWALQDAESYSKDKKIWQTMQKHYRYFYDHDIPVDFVSVEDDFSNYDLLIDPMHFLMSKAYLKKLASYVKNGGRVVGTYISGVVDENDLAYMNEWPKELQDIYGVEPLETDVLYPGQSNTLNFDGHEYKAHDYCETLINCRGKVLAKYASDFYQDTPAVVEHEYGAGKGYYLACRTNYDFLEKFYEKITANLIPEFPVKKFSSNISIQVRENKDQKYYFVQNFSDKSEQIKVDGELEDLLEKKIDRGEVVLNPFGSKIYYKKGN